MKRLILAILMIALASAASAQNTTVSGTVTDSDSIAWANGTISFNLIGTSGTVYCNGAVMTPSQLRITMNLDSSGSFSGGVCRNSSITPMSSQWGVTVCSAASSPCQNLGNTTISGSTQSLTSFISAAIKPIRIPIAFGTRAYSDGEIVNPPIGGVYYNLISGSNRIWSGTSWSQGGVQSANICTASGMKCDGTTDDSAAMQSLVITTEALGGGILQGPCGKKTVWLSQIAIPFAPATPWGMSPLRITGCNASFGGSNSPVLAPPGAPFIIDTRFAGSRILSLGQGVLEIDHTTFVNGSTNCGTLIQSTLTNVKFHDNAIWGSTLNGGLTNACDDVWLAGGTNGTNIALGGTVNDFFQGYGSVIRDNWADYIRSFVIGRVAFNSVSVVNNVIFNHSGSNATGSVTAATNAAAAVLTSTAHNFPSGVTPTLTFSGFTGNWTPLNGAHLITVIDANTFSVAVNSTGFGALTGTPVYLNGSAISIDGTATTGTNFNNAGNEIVGNLIEVIGYPFGVRLGVASQNHIGGQSCWDGTSSFHIACVWQQSGAATGIVEFNHYSTNGTLSQANGLNQALTQSGTISVNNIIMSNVPEVLVSLGQININTVNSLTSVPMTPTLPIIFRRVEWNLPTLGTGCTTTPVITVQVGGSASSFLVNMTTVNTAFQGAGGGFIDVAVNQNIQLKTTTAAAGCSVTPGNPFITVHYTMQ